MPKILPSNIRKDRDFRIRVDYRFHKKVMEFAESKKMTVSQLVRKLLQDEINKP